MCMKKFDVEKIFFDKLGGSAYVPWILAPGLGWRSYWRCAWRSLMLKKYFLTNLEGLLTFHEFWPRGGAGGQNLGHPKKLLYCFFFFAYPFLRHKVRHQSSIRPGHVMRWRSEWPIFHDWMILPNNILKNIRWMTHTWCNRSVWHKDWPHKMYVGPIFHGPVILPYIFKTIWWMKVTLDILDQCDTKIDHIKYI